MMNLGRSLSVVAPMKQRIQSGARFLFIILMVQLVNHRSSAWVSRNGNKRQDIPNSSQEKRSTASFVETTLRRAIQLSNTLANNITAAHEACDYWSVLLPDDDHSLLRTGKGYDDTVIALSLALYASCLVRVGQDNLAVQVYTRALAMNPTNEQVRLGKAQALQRLLQYQRARDEYQKVESFEGILGVATCSLRVGDLRGAIDVLSRHSDEKAARGSVRGLLGTLLYLQNGSPHQESAGKWIQSAAREEPLYRWIQGILLPEQDDVENSDPPDSYLSLIKINTCPLDDPSLVRLDDKVCLHRLLVQHQEKTKTFWPFGCIVTDSTQCNNESTINLNLDDDSTATSLYFLKERSCYGSHGNMILTASEVENNFREVQGSNIVDEKLLQRMVNPTLLLDGRKFSLRIYVIYFSPCDIYLSPHGLVKLASMRMEQQAESLSVDPRLHMTNSGRDVSMEQHDLSYLRSYLLKEEGSFESFWKRISTSVEHVFHCYQQETLASQQSEWASRREGLGIPKIMGFDFVVDSDVNPWLVEINRFPGLEPRDDSDLAVKQQVVHDAWLCAAERVSTNAKLSFGLSNQQHSLQKLNVERVI